MAIDLASRAYTGAFYATIEEEMAGSMVSRLAWMNPEADQGTEIYKMLGAVPAMREWIGKRSSTGLRTDSFEIKQKKFETGIDIPVDDIRRDKTGQVKAKIAEVGMRAVTHWNKLLSDLINSNGLCYDGQNFFDTDHVSGASGAQKNLLTASEITSLNVSAPTAPTPEEAAKIITDSVGHFMTYLDDQGEPINGEARAFEIMVSTAPLWGAFNTAISAANLSGGATNPVVATKNLSFICTLNPRLTSATQKVRIFRTDGKIVRPFIAQQEGDYTIQIKGAGSEHEIDTDHHFFGVKANRNAGYGMWQHALELQLS